MPPHITFKNSLPHLGDSNTQLNPAYVPDDANHLTYTPQHTTQNLQPIASRTLKFFFKKTLDSTSPMNHHQTTFVSKDGCKSPHTLKHLNTHQKHQKLLPPNWHPIALVVAHNIPDSINIVTHGHTPSYTRSSISQTVIQPHDDPSSFFRITSTTPKPNTQKKIYPIATKSVQH